MVKEFIMQITAQDTKSKTVKNVAVTAGVGTAISGGIELIRQKKILSNPDVFIKNAEAAANKAKEFNTPFFAGSKEASDMAIKKIDDNLSKIKQFATSGKLNFKSIAKKGLIGAGIGAGVVLGVNLFKKLLIKLGVESKKMERDIVTNPEAASAIADIQQATGAQNVQFV